MQPPGLFDVSMEHLRSLQVVEKARYEQGDNSLLREIEILCKACAARLNAHQRQSPSAWHDAGILGSAKMSLYLQSEI